MKRVKFLRSTAQHSKGGVVTLPDEQSDKAVKMGDAVYEDGPEIAGNGESVPRKRVIFTRNYKATTGQEWPKDARAYIPTKIADAAIKAGAAKEFPFNLVGNDDKAVQPVAVK